MIEITHNNLKRAIEIAKQVHPKVKAIGERSYEVIGRSGRPYAVSFVKTPSGKRLGSCGCIAHRHGFPCHHIAGAVVLHIALMRRRTNQ